MRRDDGEDENGDGEERPRSFASKKKARPSKARSRFRECATLTTVLRFIHSSAASARRPPPLFSPVQHVGPRRSLPFTRDAYARTLTPVSEYTESILHGYTVN